MKVKAYCANEKPFVYAVFSEKDAPFAFKTLEKMHLEGIFFWFPQQFSQKEFHRMDAASSVLLFLSQNSLIDQHVLLSIDYAIQLNKKILCVYLEQVNLSPGKVMQLGALQFILIEQFVDDDAFFEKLKSAEIFSVLEVTLAQKRFARRRGLASVLLPIVTIIILFFSLVVPLLIVPLVVAANGSLSQVGFGNLSLSNLAKVEELYVIGNQSYDQWHHAYYYQNSKNEVYINDLNIMVQAGNIKDISDLSLIKNAKRIAFQANQVSDISPLYQIKSLESLTLNCNPIKSLEGIEVLQNLKSISIVDTKIADISALFKIQGLESISFENTYVASIDGIEALTHLIDLRTGRSNLTDLSPLEKIDFSYLENSKDGFAFEAKGTFIQDFSPLAGIPKFVEIMIDLSSIDRILPYINGKEVRKLFLAGSDIKTIDQLSGIKGLQILHLPWSSQLVSVDGIERYEELQEIKLVGSPQLTDLTVLLQLPNLKLLLLSPDMKNLALTQLGEAKFTIEYTDY
jgi:hypothetical protein